MIKYYDTLAAYEADVKSDFESQVSLIGTDNSIKIDGRNVVVGIRSAVTGSIAVLDGLKALHFISVDTFSSLSFMSNYEIVGAVIVGVDHPSFRGEIIILNKDFAAKKMSDIYQYRLTGYTLDGTDRSGTLSIREASDWKTGHDYTVSYNADNEADFVAQLNAFFGANEPFITQKWQAVLNPDNTIDLKLYFTDYRNSYNKGLNGFTLKENAYPEWLSATQIIVKNGSRKNIALTNLSRYVAYYKSDGTNGNPNKDVTSLSGVNEVRLPAYLGTSQYQSDHCAYLRAIFGEGEQGWLRYVKSIAPLRPCEYGVVGDKSKYGDAKRNTAYLASQKWIDDGVEKPASPAADYAASVSYNHELLKKGEWVLPDADLIFDILDGIEYGTTNNRDADVINRALKAIGAPALSNSAYLWSCSRYSAGSAWCAYGGGGCASGSYLYYSLLALPLVRLRVPQSAY